MCACALLCTCVVQCRRSASVGEGLWKLKAMVATVHMFACRFVVTAACERERRSVESGNPMSGSGNEVRWWATVHVQRLTRFLQFQKALECREIKALPCFE
eukprot:TRINITY_DN68515_c0_g1_i1.p2 TRINITY_DN68515_c0_g1~~TRINITY_DN68515_c0_g1_i1.p2  ORF type:complete len:101 (+),score=6.59 TRINITY_DN68515_c0_g1_i1:54-356(+)